MIVTSIYYQFSVINYQPQPQQQLSSAAQILSADNNDADIADDILGPTNERLIYMKSLQQINTNNNRHHLNTNSDIINYSTDINRSLSNYNVPSGYVNRQSIDNQLLNSYNDLVIESSNGNNVGAVDDNVAPDNAVGQNHQAVPIRNRDTIYRLLNQQQQQRYWKHQQPKHSNANSYDLTSDGDLLDSSAAKQLEGQSNNDQQNVPSPIDSYLMRLNNKIRQTNQHQQRLSINRLESLQAPNKHNSNGKNVVIISGEPSNTIKDNSYYRASDSNVDSAGGDSIDESQIHSSDNSNNKASVSFESSLNDSKSHDGILMQVMKSRLNNRNKDLGNKQAASILNNINKIVVMKTKEEELQDEQDDQQDAAVIPPPSNPSGPGEMGRPVVLKNLTKEQQDVVNVGWENNAFNQYVSDLISFNRTLPDVRDPSCKSLKYPNPIELPATSVIICFHNEAWSVLLRTVHSIINRSPKRLVKEIVLVDDFSNKPHLGEQLENYVKPLKIVKIVRAKKREGLIRARLLGAKAATAPVLTFLDSHCECAEGWLEPLLTRIQKDPHTVVCPVIDVINDKTFEYQYRGDASAINVGGFDWNLQFNWHSIPERERKRRAHPYEPVRSPTMAGGLFSIDKAFFEKLGTYDSGFDIWGGENLELSFKTWMCGGTLEIIPCSHVGHIFRSRSPYKWRSGVNVLKRNSVRLAEVWMDEYKKYYYDRIGHDLGDFGDVSERIKLRQELQCKPFSYFVKEIYPELFIPGEAVAYGEVRNEAHGDIKMCLDSPARKSEMHKPLGVYPCHGAGGNQYWLLSKEGEIRRDEACVDYAGQNVILFPCHGSGGNQLWYYDQESQHIRHSTSGMCMELAGDRIKLKMSDCHPHNDAQRWTFQHYNQTLASISSSSSSSSGNN